MNKFLLYIFSFFIFSFESLALGDTLLLTDTKKVYSLTQYITVHSDFLCTKPVSTFYSSNNIEQVFFKFHIINSSSSKKYLFGFGDSNEKITLYLFDGNEIVDSFFCGSKYTLTEKAVKTGRGEFVRTFLPVNKPLKIVVKVENKSAFARQLLKYSTEQIRAYHPEAFDATRNLMKFINVFFYGGILLMIFYNLMLAISLNSRGYAFYVVFAVLFLFFNFVSDGLIREAFFPETVNNFHVLRLLVVPLMLIVYIQFGRIYMQSSYLVMRADRYAKYLMWANLMSYLPMFINEWWLARIIILVLAIITLCFMMAVAVMSLARNYFPARYFLIGNTIFFISGMIYILYLMRVIPHTGSNQMFEYTPQIGAIFDLAIFSLGLANRIKVIEQELVKNEIESEHERQSLIEEKNRELEQRVKERTEELIAQKEEIAAINEELEEKVRERTKKLQKAYRDLLNLNYELDTFIYRAAHDIRGPITTIMGLCNLALMEKDFKKCQEYLLVLDKFSKNTQFTLNRILSVNEIKNNHIKPSHFTLGKLRDGVLAMLIDNPNRNKVSITFEMDDNVTVYYDYNLLQLIIHSMVDNAVRFRSNDLTVKPSCNVSIFIEEDGSFKARVVDNGQGIESAIKEKVFDMFYRGNEYSSGSGLGLYISKIAAKKLSGDVYLISSQKGETIFEVHLAKLKERKIQYSVEEA